jgi:two-component system sensor histidine kinase/response regulator
VRNPASILVVDDEPNNFDVIEMLLLKDGYSLSYVPNGFEALSYLEQTPPDVILLDVMMPGLSGIEVCQRIRANSSWQHIPIIFVTALNTKEDLARCLEAGADDFISKPVNRLELQARIRSMLRIKQQYDALEATLQLREDMSNMIVHDLRNPLSSIVLACTLLQFAELGENQRKKIDQITVAGQQLESMIDSLLLMAKLESGKLAVNRVEVDLSALGMSAIADLEAIAAQKKINLVSRLPAPGGSAWVDIPVFRRVLDNLLTNAIKFSPEESEVTLEISYLPDLQARIRVFDQGLGVSASRRQHIFEKYEIAQIVKKSAQTGLGLAFAKLAIAAHDGNIFVEENTPRGSIFTIEI